jgi:hypothetical protein
MVYLALFLLAAAAFAYYLAEFIAYNPNSPHPKPDQQ